MIVVTPSLFIGQPSDTSFFDDLFYHENVQEAASRIQGGQSALLYEDPHWATRACLVLEYLGVEAMEAARIVAGAHRVNEGSRA